MRNVLALLLSLLLLAALSVPVWAEEAPVPIYTPEDLLKMAEDPTGSYILMADLDMAGIAWKGPDFSGSFDGNGHALLNLELTQVGDTRYPSYDGNAKSYETDYLGFFSTMRNAQVKNLKLINVTGCLTVDTPCFAGAIAGYGENVTITNCTVTGCLELRAHDRIFGLGGLVGYGSGQITGCTVDMTLICVDTDATTRDEQFLGGAYATGYINVQDCGITLDGFVSEHGYAHNGGIVGMYMKYPLGQGTGYITGNQVSGKITFFEDNTNRRAYCEAFVGESLVSPYVLRDNTQDFLRDERTDVTRELRPELCAAPVYTEETVCGSCDQYGYTRYTCSGCGYSYRDNYTLFVHSASQWTVETPATVEAEGRSVAVCDGCGLALERTDPKLEPPPTTEPATEPTTVPTTAPTEPTPPAAPQQGSDLLLPIVGAALAAVLLAVLAVKGRRAKKS